MPLHRTGRNIIASLVLGETVTPLLTTTGAVLWVGSGTADHDPTDNHLRTGAAGAGNPSTMESGYPIRAVNQMTFRGIYATDVANYEWQEWGIKNATTTVTSTSGDGFMLQRKQESLGTKLNTQQWQLTVDVSMTTAFALFLCKGIWSVLMGAISIVA